jgi:glucoamylase
MPEHAANPRSRRTRSSVARRSFAGRLTSLVLCAALLLAWCAAAVPQAGTGHAFFPLDSGTMALGRGGEIVKVFDADDLVPGTRVLAGTPDSTRLAAEQRAWLASGTVPTVPELGSSTMVRDALLDLHVLSHPYGVAVAGWAPPWRYVWPRDSALVATALARTGHLADADRVLTFLERSQPENGIFAARYRPDGTGVPDGRGPQTDSVGWALWALQQVVQTLPSAEKRPFVERHRQLLDSSARAAETLLDNPRSLPPASSDYWETSERKLTLSTAALLHAGLRSAADLYAELGEPEQSRQADALATRTAAAIQRAFGPRGYPRVAGGSPSSVDLGVSYLLPPFAATADEGVLQIWRASAARMARPAGGLAPGGAWRRDGVSWNTATSSYAMTAAFVGPREVAVARLGWLDQHRTALGSLPEKVLADGEPASVAPLAWAAAAVIIAADQLGPAGQ